MSRAQSITDVSIHWPSFRQVWETLTFQAGFNTSVVMTATALLGFAAGIVGTFALLRKRSLTADALSHSTLPGIGLAFIAADAIGLAAKSMPVLLVGAATTGILGVLLIHWITRHTRLTEDASIGIVLSVLFGLGVAILSIVPHVTRTPPAGLHHFIYGQTAAMSVTDTVLIGSIAIFAALTAMLLMKELRVVCFNDEFAHVVGLHVTTIDLILMSLIVTVTVAGLQAVGLILIVALLIIPAAAARFWSDRLWLVVLLASCFGALSGYLGSTASALLPRQPTGAVIVLVSGVLFTISMLIAPRRGIVADVARRTRLRLKIAADHVLETMHLQEQNDTPAPAAMPPAAERTITRIVAFAVLWLGRFIMFHHGQWTLTDRGRRRGARVARNHRLWEQYLISYAAIAPSHVDWSVDTVEHVLSPELVKELESDLSHVAKQHAP